MGKGVIVSHLGDAHYRIGLDIDVSYARNQLAAIQTYLDEFAPKYAEATQKKDDAKTALTPINDRLTEYLAAGQAASQAAYDAMVAAYEAYADAVQNLPDQQMVQEAQDAADELSGEFAANPNEETALDTVAADSLWQSLVGDFLDVAAVQAATDAKNAAISDLVTAQQEFDLGNIPEQALTFFQQNYATLRGDWLTIVSENSGPARVQTLEGQWQQATEAFDTARKDLGKLLGSGGLPEDLAAILSDQEKAYADYHAALANWQNMLLVKTEKEALRAELQSRLLPYTDNDGAPIRQEVNAWCCDATEDLSPGAEVATIEIPGERDLAVRVRPGYESRETYTAERDGILQPSWAGSPEQTYWNWALHPGNARWHPNYRLGELLLIDPQAGTCTVQLDQQTNNAKSRARDGSVLDVNNPIKYEIDPDTGEQTVILPGDNVQVDSGVTTLTDVPIEYMECNADAFEVGDHVMVEFQGRDWTQTKVIGFAENPRACQTHGLILSGLISGSAESLFLKDTPSGTPGDFRHMYGTGQGIQGGNIDWKSADGKVVITWDGPISRSLPMRPALFSNNGGTGFWTGRWESYNELFFSPDANGLRLAQHLNRFRALIFSDGAIIGNAPEGHRVLGAARCTYTPDEGPAKHYLVAAFCGPITGPRYQKTLYGDQVYQWYRLDENLEARTHYFAWAPYPARGQSVSATGWTIAEEIPPTVYTLPPDACYFFSESGTKATGFIPYLVEGTTNSLEYNNGLQFANDKMVRLAITPGADAVQIAASITTQDGGDGFGTYSLDVSNSIDDEFFAGSFSYAESRNISEQSTGIIAADYIGEEEVTLTAFYALSSSTIESRNATAQDYTCAYSVTSSDNTSITVSVIDSVRGQVLTYSYALTGARNMAGDTADGSETNAITDDRNWTYTGPLYYDLRYGGGSHEDSSMGMSQNRIEIFLAGNYTITDTRSHQWDFAITDRNDSRRNILTNSAYNPGELSGSGIIRYPPLAEAVSIFETQIYNPHGAAWHARIAPWREPTTAFTSEWYQANYNILHCNESGDVVANITPGVFVRPSCNGAGIGWGSVALPGQPNQPITSSQIATVFSSAFDIDDAWHAHLDALHPPPEGEEQIYTSALEADITPVFRR